MLVVGNATISSLHICAHSKHVFLSERVTACNGSQSPKQSRSGSKPILIVLLGRGVKIRGRIYGGGRRRISEDFIQFFLEKLGEQAEC